MKEKIKIGYIGLGRRGFGVLKGNVSDMDDVEIAMICDQPIVESKYCLDAIVKDESVTDR